MLMIIASLLVSGSAFAKECYNIADCLNGYYCKIQWREPPYQCVKKTAKNLNFKEADSEMFPDDEFISSGESLQSMERAAENAETNANISCSSGNIHFLAKRVSPFKEGSYPRNVCNLWHQPNCRVIYIFTSTAKFQCINGV